MRHGTRWLDPLLRYVQPVRVRTGIAVTALSPEATDRYPVQSGSLVGIWIHQARGGYRAWYEAVSGTLNAEARRQYDVLVGRASATTITWPLAPEASPADTKFAAWTTLVQAHPPTLDWSFSAIPGADRLERISNTFDPNFLDFDVLDLSVTQIEDYLNALQSLTVTDPERAGRAYLGFLMAAQEWLYHHRADRFAFDRARLVESVSALSTRIAASRLDRGLSAISREDSEALLNLAMNGYFETAGAALARLRGDHERDAKIRKLALVRLAGNKIGVEELLAIRVLAYGADSSPDAKESVERVREFFRAAGNPENTDFTKFLIDAADGGALPDSVRADLLEGAREATKARELQFLDQEHARILAHGARQLAASERDTAYALIERLAAGITPRSETLAEIYGALARHRLDRPEMLKRVLEQCANLTNRSFRPNEDPYHQIITGGAGWAVALAEFGKTRALTDDARAMLRWFALLASLEAFRTDFELALARQAMFAGDPCTKSLCLNRLQTLADDSGARRLQTALAAQMLSRLPRDIFLQRLNELREGRDAESEPEVRTALGELIVDAQLDRLAPRQQ